ncbi:hypothetical protein JL721_11412 [Aureococcus anophagefferens]|nr:hypothetical protein JL721_11412 [Aureococcus anophagefferens]
MTACARCAALLVACCVVGAGSQAPPRPILAVSVSRSGGGTLCDLACRQFHGGPDMDCRLEGGAFHYLKALNGSVADHNLTFAATARAMAADAALCNAVVVEPGRRLGAGARAVLDAAAAAPAGASLWTAYAWLLLVRDPIKRFVSYAAKTRGLDRRLDAAGFRAAVRGGGSEGDRRQLRNFATRHLLPGARFNATADACAPDVLAAALAVLPRYAAVLNLADLPGESYFVPKASSTATMAVLAAAEAPGVLAYVSAADPAGPDAGRRLCYTCPYRAAPPWPPGRPKVAITFAWTREPTFRFISGYYTETSIGHLAHLPHFAVATEPADLELEFEVRPRRARDGPARFHAFVSDMFAASRERLLTGHLALQAPVLKSATLCELLAVDYAALGYAWPPACAAYAATVAARDEAGRVGKLQGEVAELRDEVARLTKLLAEKAVDAPKPSGPPTKPKPRRCKGKVCF